LISLPRQIRGNHLSSYITVITKEETLGSSLE
jgi:hypothetical protein